jgi:YHS domain-containing protein
MKSIHRISLLALVLAASALTTSALADDKTPPVPDLMTNCPVSGEKLGGDMGAPYVFTYKGQEIKLCCKGCLKDFKKDPKKYVALIRAADKK